MSEIQHTSGAIVPTSTTQLAPADATDERVIAMWLHGRPAHTQAAYRRDTRRLLDGRPGLRQLTLADLQAFADSLSDMKPSSQKRTLSSVKSLLTFAHKIGYTQVNVGAALRLPKARGHLAERIQPEEAIQRMLALEPNPRNHAMIRILYGSAIRISELVGLRWRDVVARSEAGQITVLGKGQKTRTILLSAATWAELAALPRRGPDAPVFATRTGKPVDRHAMLRIVKAAAKRAGLPEGFSPHWLRHAHASHALDRGAPISLVKDTLGHADISTTGQYLHARPDDSSGRYLPI